ncbi:PREDICTED: uncharacterized protein LOC104820411 [Tarenaya hassleriana]|uniref:uncharacterized protein LOC104820411 n=1 Tax=Tarenaya hassleriana TaxID=28532 RepID=UPI00053C3BFE|nr:PREDICTED: uncharacterized protein LOC104820411 [Tarenaya hassleriana]
MAHDSEKRFHQIMDKLFSPPSKSPLSSSSTSSPGEQQSRGKKRPNPSSALALVEPRTGLDATDRRMNLTASSGSSHSALCRPWDRGDLMKRLSTFKSMMWFAKPQVISAVNCARRGWVNVDMDTLACESCGAHLLFSTPSSWSRQQVEKAASVFSLKLDSGHKLLCPWIDNSCEETLADFPPLTPQDLVDRFQERSDALLQLLALPVVSPSAIEYMKSPELEEFLKQPITPLSGNMPGEFSRPQSLGDTSEFSSAQLFYQAQKLISLCGWEPRALPYIVDCKEKPGDSSRTTSVVDLLPEPATGKLLSVSTQTSFTSGIPENGANPVNHESLRSDPNSVVLDCKLCGACAGLWVFSVVPRPLELHRVTGYTEVNRQKDSGGHDSGSNTLPNQRANVLEQNSSLNFTIAGGPPATKQNFKATISFPIIGRNLRLRFASEFRDPTQGNRDCVISSGSEKIGLIENGKGDQGNNGDIQDQQLKTAENSDGAKENNDQEMADTEEIRTENGRSDPNVTVNTELQSKDQEVMAEKSLHENNKQKHSTSGQIAASSKQMEFDPIRQHRHFCPWILPTGRRGPGWRQTLSALQRQRESSQSSPSATSLLKVDDPITCVRNLFKSPSAKRQKPNSGSSP